jgi:hypothetical protein
MAAAPLASETISQSPSSCWRAKRSFFPDALTDEPKTLEEIVQEAGVVGKYSSNHTRHLKKLVLKKLVAKTADGKYRLAPKGDAPPQPRAPETIRIDPEVWLELQKRAVPFVETPNDVLRRLLGLGNHK